MSDPVAGWPDAAAARAQAAKQKADVKAKKEAFLALQARYTREAGYRVSDYEVGLASAAEQRGEDWRRAISHRTDPLTRILRAALWLVSLPLLWVDTGWAAELVEWIDRKLTYR